MCVFARVYVCAPQARLVPSEVKRGLQKMFVKNKNNKKWTSILFYLF